MPYKLVCFDMDGVLYSSEAMIADAFRDAVLEYRKESGKVIAVPELPRIMEEVGRPIRTIYANLFPQLTLEDRDRVSVLALDALEKMVRAEEGTLLSNALEILEHLRMGGVAVGLASNGRAQYLDAILETYGMDQFFPDRAVIDGSALPDKGSLITHAMERHGIAPSDTLMVGDRLTDYDAAHQAGVDFACVLTGHGSDFSDHQFTWSVHDLEELVPIVLGEENARV